MAIDMWQRTLAVAPVFSAALANLAEELGFLHLRGILLRAVIAAYAAWRLYTRLLFLVRSVCHRHSAQLRTSHYFNVPSDPASVSLSLDITDAHLAAV